MSTPRRTGLSTPRTPGRPPAVRVHTGGSQRGLSEGRSISFGSPGQSQGGAGSPAHSYGSPGPHGSPNSSFLTPRQVDNDMSGRDTKVSFMGAVDVQNTARNAMKDLFHNVQGGGLVSGRGNTWSKHRTSLIDKLKERSIAYTKNSPQIQNDLLATLKGGQAPMTPRSPGGAVSTAATIKAVVTSLGVFSSALKVRRNETSLRHPGWFKRTLVRRTTKKSGSELKDHALAIIRMKRWTDEANLKARAASVLEAAKKWGVKTEIVGSRDRVPYWMQGDESLYSLDMMKKREILRKHMEVNNSIHKFWGHMDQNLDGEISKDEYIASNVAIFKILMEQCGQEVDINEATASAEADFLCDSQGKDALDYMAFHNCMFELVDNWTPSIKASDYVEFLDDLYREFAKVMRRRTTKKPKIVEKEKVKVEPPKEVPVLVQKPAPPPAKTKKTSLPKESPRTKIMKPKPPPERKTSPTKTKPKPVKKESIDPAALAVPYETSQWAKKELQKGMHDTVARVLLVAIAGMDEETTPVRTGLGPRRNPQLDIESMWETDEDYEENAKDGKDLHDFLSNIKPIAGVDKYRSEKNRWVSDMTPVRSANISGTQAQVLRDMERDEIAASCGGDDNDLDPDLTRNVRLEDYAAVQGPGLRSKTPLSTLTIDLSNVPRYSTVETVPESEFRSIPRRGSAASGRSLPSARGPSQPDVPKLDLRHSFAGADTERSTPGRSTPKYSGGRITPRGGRQSNLSVYASEPEVEEADDVYLYNMPPGNMSPWKGGGWYPMSEENYDSRSMTKEQFFARTPRRSAGRSRTPGTPRSPSPQFKRMELQAVNPLGKKGKGVLQRCLMAFGELVDFRKSSEYPGVHTSRLPASVELLVYWTDCLSTTPKALGAIGITFGEALSFRQVLQLETLGELVCLFKKNALLGTLEEFYLKILQVTSLRSRSRADNLFCILSELAGEDTSVQDAMAMIRDHFHSTLKDPRVMFDHIRRNMHEGINRRNFVLQLAKLGLPISPAMLDSIFTVADENRDGLLHFDEFSKHFSHCHVVQDVCGRNSFEQLWASHELTGVMAKQDPKRIFRAMDADFKGWVSFTDFLCFAVNALRVMNLSLSSVELAAYAEYMEMDYNRNGMIDRIEFAKRCKMIRDVR